MKVEYLSPSRSNVYIDCEFQYFLKYELKLPELGQATIHTHKGSAVHFALEMYAKGDKDYTKHLKDYYKEHNVWYFDNRPSTKGFAHPQPKACESCPWAVSAGKSFICSVVERPVSQFDGCPKGNFEDDLNLSKKTIEKDSSPLKLKILAAEFPFSDEMEGFKMHGFIDLIVEVNEDTIEVVDYKTGNYAKTTSDALEDLQMRMYSLIVKKHFPKYRRVMMTLNYLRKQPVTVIFDKNDDQKTLDYLKNLYNEIKANQNPKRTKSFKCGWCVGYETCGKIREQFLDEKGKFQMPKSEDKK